MVPCPAVGHGNGTLFSLLRVVQPFSDHSRFSAKGFSPISGTIASLLHLINISLMNMGCRVGGKGYYQARR